MEIFDVLAANMAGVVRSARETILGMSLFERDAFDTVMRGYERWAKRPDAGLWFAVASAEGTRQ